MRIWIAGVLASVAAALITAFATGLLKQVFAGKESRRPVVRITAVNVDETDYIDGPAWTASITVENDGRKTAEACVADWETGLVETSIPRFPGSPVYTDKSNEFALRPDASRTVQVTAYGTLPRQNDFQGPLYAVWIRCSNAASRVERGREPNF